MARAVGWKRTAWEELSGVTGLGADLPPQRPGCGSRTLDPGVADQLLVRRRGHTLHSRKLEVGGVEDEFEAMFARGWSDGLPVVPPTPARVLHMLEGTSRRPDEVVAVVPPDLVPCSVEKVAVNAVLAGCRPAHLPVVLAVVEAACTSEFNAHGLLATTYFSGPVVVVDGPITREIDMNGGVNALGQGNRANSPSGGRSSWSSATSAAGGPARSTGRRSTTRKALVLLRRGRGGLAVAVAGGVVRLRGRRLGRRWRRRAATRATARPSPSSPGTGSGA